MVPCGRGQGLLRLAVRHDSDGGGSTKALCKAMFQQNPAISLQNPQTISFGCLSCSQTNAFSCCDSLALPGQSAGRQELIPPGYTVRTAQADWRHCACRRSMGTGPGGLTLIPLQRLQHASLDELFNVETSRQTLLPV
ncbi:hypothetical protein BaRGS_00039095, partial [Batillaria attramentaria]